MQKSLLDADGREGNGEHTRVWSFTANEEPGKGGENGRGGGGGGWWDGGVGLAHSVAEGGSGGEREGEDSKKKGGRRIFRGWSKPRDTREGGEGGREHAQA